MKASFLCSPTETSVVQVSLKQGDIECSASPRILVTVLGSCVSVCLWDKRRAIGGMNHFVLPNDIRGERNGRYGDFAVGELIRRMLQLGCRIEDLQAKVFGGAAVLPFGSGQTVGSSNVTLALASLKAERIPVKAQRTGGILGQQIRFHTQTGDIFIRTLTVGIYSGAHEHEPA